MNVINCAEVNLDRSRVSALGHPKNVCFPLKAKSSLTLFSAAGLTAISGVPVFSVWSRNDDDKCSSSSSSVTVDYTRWRNGMRCADVGPIYASNQQQEKAKDS